MILKKNHFARDLSEEAKRCVKRLDQNNSHSVLIVDIIHNSLSIYLRSIPYPLGNESNVNVSVVIVCQDKSMSQTNEVTYNIWSLKK